MSQLFPYQEVGADFLAKRRLALLADEMGLGKTVQAIRGLDRIHAKKVLVICPSVAKINWLREFEEWAAVSRKYKVCQELIDLPDNETSVICSFEFATENHPYLKSLGFDVLVVDEAHYLKEHGTKRSSAILGKNGIARGVKRIWFLSGTPAPNHPGELWLMLYSFGLTKLKYNDFLEKFCLTKKTSYGLKVIGANRQAIPELQQLLKPLMLRRLKDEVMKELPPITYNHIFVEPGEVRIEVMPSFVEYYFPVDRREELFEIVHKQEKLISDVLLNLKRPEGRDALPVIQSMWDSVSTMRRYVGLQKLQPAIDIIKSNFKYNAYQYNKLVIFAIHTDVIETLRKELREFNPVTLYGKTPPEKRQKRIDKFQNNPKCKIFIGNIRAAGVAITLTAANNILFIEQDWVPGNNAQAVMRCHRIGQKKPVFVRFLALDNSIDKHIMKILKAKTRDLTEIFDQNILQSTQQNDKHSKQL